MSDQQPSHKFGGVVFTQLSVMMFLQFFLWGAWYVTMNPFMEAQGMAAEMIGWAYTMGPIAAIVSPFFLGIIADRLFPTERVLGVMHLLGGVLLCLAPFAAQQSSGFFVTVVLAHMLCYMPTLGLTSSLAMHNMTNSEKQFPMIRVFGTIGWIVAGLIISASGFDKSQNMFYLAGASGILLGLFSFSLPHTPAPSKGEPFSAREALGLDSLVLLKNRSFAVFCLCSFLICIPLAAYYSFAGTYVGKMGFENIAATMSIGQGSEIFFMLVIPFCFARLGVKWMLAIGMLAWVARYGLFAAGATDQVRWMVIAGIVLHGICYDFFFVTGQIYVDNESGPKIRGQAQGFYVLLTQGLGMLIGAQLVGRLVGHYTTELADGTSVVDWKTVWTYPAIFAFVVLIVFVLLFKHRNSTMTTDEVIEEAEIPDPV
jgi:nucleoside transporter